jgi:hypothetical protein
MIWVSIILSIIEAIPTLITVIQDILKAIHGNPVQHAAFRQLLTAHADFVDPVKAEADIRAFHAQVTAPAA